MKTSSLLIALSLLANGVLLAVLAFPPATAPLPAASPAASRPSAPGPAVVAPGVATVAVPVADLWSRLHNHDYDEFNRRLRAAGFPPREVRALLAMAINEETQARSEAIRGRREDLPYWKSPYQSGPMDRERIAQLSDIYKESTALNYKYVSGPDALVDNEDALVVAQRRFGKLPLEKLQLLTAMQHDAEMAQMESDNPLSQARDPAGQKAYFDAMRAREQEQLAAVARILTPEELEQYELRNKAGGLRGLLANFRPTEEEFKALYAVEKQRGSVSSREEYLALAQAVLSADRYAEYAVTMTSDGTGKLGQLISRLELPLTTIPTINGVRDDIRARAKAINTDPALTAAQRETRIATLAQEADEKLTATLGQRGYEAYKDLKGEWLRALKPKAGPGGP